MSPVRLVGCPHCCAPPYAPCVSLATGRQLRLSDHHPSRRDAAGEPPAPVLDVVALAGVAS